MRLLGHLKICLHKEQIWEEFLLGRSQDGARVEEITHVTRQSVGSPQPKAQQRMKRLNQGQGLLVTGRHDGPMRVQIPCRLTD